MTASIWAPGGETTLIGAPEIITQVGGTANAITLTPLLEWTSYVTNKTLRFIAALTNTGSTTVNVSGLGVKTIKDSAGNDLEAGAIVEDGYYELIYDGTNFVGHALKGLDPVSEAVDITVTGGGTLQATIDKIWGNYLVAKSVLDYSPDAATTADIKAGTSVADHSSWIQTAITANRVLFFPDGTYNLGNITIPTGTTIFGAGKFRTYLHIQKLIYSGLILNGVSNITIFNLSIGHGATAGQRDFEVISNGTFATDTLWERGVGWTIAAGVATSDGTQVAASDIDQAPIELVTGHSYTVTFDVTARTAGSVRPIVGGTLGTARTAVGTYTETIVAGATGVIGFQASEDFVGSIDNASAGSAGVAITSSAASTGIDIINVRVYDMSKQGITGTFVKSRIDGWELYNIGRGGIVLTDSEGVTITGGKSENTGDDAVALNGLTYNSIVSNNKFYASGMLLNQGVAVKSHHSSNVIIGNLMDSFYNFAIELKQNNAATSSPGTTIIANNNIRRPHAGGTGLGHACISAREIVGTVRISNNTVDGLEDDSVGKANLVRTEAGGKAKIIVTNNTFLNGLNTLVETTSVGTIIYKGNTSVNCTTGIARSPATQLLTNGTFASDTVWTKGTGWTIAAGAASSDGTQVADSSLSQTPANMIAGRQMLVTYTLTWTAGTVKVRAGGGTPSTARAASGTYNEIINVGNANALFEIVADLDFVGSVDNVVALQEIMIATDNEFEGDLTAGNGFIDLAGTGDGLFSIICNNNQISGTTYIAELGQRTVGILNIRDNVQGGAALTNATNGVIHFRTVDTSNQRRVIRGDEASHKLTFADGDTTPSVQGSDFFVCANTGATAITAFDDLVEGKKVSILLDANTTIVRSGTLLTDTGGNLPAAGAALNNIAEIWKWGGITYARVQLYT